MISRAIAGTSWRRSHPTVTLPSSLWQAVITCRAHTSHALATRRPPSAYADQSVDATASISPLLSRLDPQLGSISQPNLPSTPMATPWPAIAALLLALAVHVHHFFGPLDSYAFLPRALLPAGAAATEQHFRDSYYQARALFRSRATAVDHATLHSLPLPELQALGLTIDVAVIGGPSRRADRVLLHMSGTHGVEGFAGSAIQSRLLERLAEGEEAEAEAGLPTLVFVHAVNPFGFSQVRRGGLPAGWLVLERGGG